MRIPTVGRPCSGRRPVRPSAVYLTCAPGQFGEPVARLFGPPYGMGAATPAERSKTSPPGAEHRWEGQVIAKAADRARDFLARIEVSNVGQGTLDHGQGET